MNVSLSERSEREESLRAGGGTKIPIRIHSSEHRLNATYKMSIF